MQVSESFTGDALFEDQSAEEDSAAWRVPQEQLLVERGSPSAHIVDTLMT